MLSPAATLIRFYGFFTASGVPATGITVTCTITRINADGTTSTVVTAGTTTLLSTGLYYYALASTSDAIAGDYVALFTASPVTGLDQTTVPALWIVGGGLDAAVSTRVATGDTRLANLDAAVSTRAATADTRLANLDAAVSTRAATADSRLANLDATVSSRAATADTRLANLANLDAAVSTRAATADTRLANLDTAVSTRAATADARFAYLDAAISTRLAAAGYTGPLTSAQVAAAVWTASIYNYGLDGTLGYQVRNLGLIAGQGVWDAPIAYHMNVGTFGYNLDAEVSSRAATADTRLANLDAAVSTRAATADPRFAALDAAISTRLAATGYTGPLTGTQVANAVWDALTSAHHADFSFGAVLGPISGLNGPQIASAVWDALTAQHTTAGTFGAGLGAGGGITPAQVTTAVWDAPTASHDPTGSFGALVEAVATRLQGGGKLSYIGPVDPSGGTIRLIAGDGYYAAENRALHWTVAGGPNLTGATVLLVLSTGQSYAATVTTPAGPTANVTVELTETLTTALAGKSPRFALQATLASGHAVTLAQGTLTCAPRV